MCPEFKYCLNISVLGFICSALEVHTSKLFIARHTGHHRDEYVALKLFYYNVLNPAAFQ